MKKGLAAQFMSREILLGAAVCAIIAFLDYFTGYGFNIVLFYFFPILWVTWRAGMAGGIFLSIISALAWFSANLLTRTVDISMGVHYWNASLRLLIFIGFVILLALLKKSKENELLAKVDPLTGAGNLRAFHERGGQEARRARRYGRPLSIAYLDLDNFKRINDTMGHSTGNEVLCAVVKTLNENIRSSDIIARVGGDEFVLLFPETNYESFNAALQKTHKMLLEAMHRKNWPVTFTLGAVTFAIPPESIETLLTVADRVMYSAKKAGKNRILHRNTEAGSEWSVPGSGG